MENMNRRNHHKNKVFGKYDYRNILNFPRSFYSGLIKIEQNQSYPTKIGQVILEYKMTNLIQGILDICNPHYKSFKLRSEMEESI